ncbi:hypothetical protein GGX14DRAFT_571802 [Mycena pura]|uniref:Uncharacterized protein n=1 Tax=Mycena pura TaxID=153505 RepID=A0AAD6V9G9_9AGAR|nr:hypothetical protein GGX14DRAFT_571802 [Mycena pura]
MVPASGIALILHALLVFSSSGHAQAALTNTTVDDTTIDDTNEQFWSFPGPWVAITPSTPCHTCRAQPNPELAHNNTWHDGSATSGAFEFQAYAVYIYGIDFPDSANMTFNISSSPTSSFHYYAGPVYVYNSLFFSATGLDPTTKHTVTWLFTQPNTGGIPSGLLDYAVVTVDQPEGDTSATGSGSSLPSSPSTDSPNLIKQKSNTGVIIGTVVGVIGGLALSAAFISKYRRRSRAQSTAHAIEPYNSLTASRPSPERAKGWHEASFPSGLPRVPSVMTPNSEAEPVSAVMARDPHAWDLEARVRNLEELVASEPPAYN